MLGTEFLVYHACYMLCIIYASRGLFKLRSKLWLNYIYGEHDAFKCRCASTPHYKDRILVVICILCNNELFQCCILPYL